MQLCTPLGWRYLSFEAPSDCSELNVPETNYQMLGNADFGVMFEFNRKFAPSVVSPASVNVTAGNKVFVIVQYISKMFLKSILYCKNI